MKRLGAQEFRLYSGLTIITGLLAAGEFPLVLNTYVHNAEDAKRKGAPVDWVAQEPVFTKFQPIGVGAKAPHPNAAKLFVDFMLVRGRTKNHRLVRPRADSPRRADQRAGIGQIEFRHR